MTHGHFRLFKHMAEIEELKEKNGKLEEVLVGLARIITNRQSTIRRLEKEIMHLSNELESERMRRLIHSETHRSTA